MFDPADYDDGPDLDTLRRDEEADRAAECPGGRQCTCGPCVRCYATRY